MGAETDESLSDRVRRLDAAWKTKRDLWLRGLNGVSEESVRKAVRTYIRAAEDLQVEKWGRVRVRFSEAALLR